MGLSVAFDLATHRGYDSDHPRVEGDVGKAGRGDRLGRGHEDPLRPDPPREDVGVDDHERRRAAHAGLLHRGRRGAGGRPGPAQRDHPERHPQGVHGPQHVHLPARAEHADRGRHHRVHGAAHAPVQLDLDLRLPHAGGGGDGRPGAGVHHRRRARVRALRPRPGPRHRQVRRAAVVLLRHRHELLHGGGQAAGGPPAVAPGHLAVRPPGPPLGDAAHALPDQRRVAHRAGPLQQRGAHRGRGHGRRAGRHAEPAHQQLRRGAGPADRLLGPHRPQHAAHPGRGDRHPQGGRPAGRQLLRRGAHQHAGRRGLGARSRRSRSWAA